MSSSLRKNTILAKLTVRNGISTRDLHQALLDEGFQCSLRTVQRDLNDLYQFGVEREDDNLKYWNISKEGNFQIKKLDITTAVTWVLANQYLAGLLPLHMRENLTPYTEEANRYLADHTNKSASSWNKKITLHEKGLPLKPFEIPADILEAIYGALLNESCVQLQYRSFTSKEDRTFIFHPYGVIMRGERSYLVGKYHGHESIRQLSLCRVKSAEKLEQKAQIEADFSLPNYIAQGELSVIRNKEKIQLKLWIDAILNTLLQETPLADDQQVEPEYDDFILTATVDDTDELRHWLLSVCNRATVLEPSDLRNELKAILTDSLSYYDY